MVITLELPAALLHEVKEFAFKQGVPFSEVLETSLRHYLAGSSQRPFKLREPIAWNPEELIDSSDWATMKAFINEEHDRRALDSHFTK